MIRQIFFVLATLIVFSISARADDVILSGTATVPPGPFTVVVMNFSGANFSVNAAATGAPVTFRPCISGCLAGDVISLSVSSGVWTPSDVSGQMKINGTVYTFLNQAIPPASLPDIVGSGSMTFTAGSAVIPSTNDSIVILTAPFTAAGFLGGQAFNGSVGLDLRGSGIATLELNNLGNGQFSFRNLTYTFQTPEPTTIILLCTGLAGVALRFRQLRR